MKKLASVLSLSAYFSLASTAFAANTSTVNTCPAGTFNKLCNITLTNVVSGLIGLVFILAVLIAFGFLIYGGIKWVTSGGDKTAVAAAREHIIAAIVGLLIVFLSYVILNLVLNFFLGINLGNFTLPHL